AIGTFALRVLLGAADFGRLAARLARLRLGRIELDLGDAGEADTADRRGRPLQDRRAVLHADPDPDELRAVRLEVDRADLANRHPAEGDAGAVGETLDRLLEEDVVGLLAALADLAQPDDEDDQRRDQAEHDAADEYLVGTSLHQAPASSMI